MSSYDFSIPSDFGSIKKKLMDERNMMIFLAVGFAASLISLISVSYCADRIGVAKLTTDKAPLDDASSKLWIAIVFNALIVLGTAGAMAHVMFYRSKSE
jgi:hypothetical protein